jgi:queuine/archaeosine tRNA-ribosyltransferase
MDSRYLQRYITKTENVSIFGIIGASEIDQRENRCLRGVKQMTIEGEFVTIFNVTLTLKEAQVIYNALRNYKPEHDEDEIQYNLTFGFGSELEREKDMRNGREND